MPLEFAEETESHKTNHARVVQTLIITPENDPTKALHAVEVWYVLGFLDPVTGYLHVEKRGKVTFGMEGSLALGFDFDTLAPYLLEVVQKTDGTVVSGGEDRSENIARGVYDMLVEAGRVPATATQI